MNILRKCDLCPRNCKVDRYKIRGFCGASNKVRVAYYHLHKWEEPIISGTNGSGTVFFSHCNMKCIYCQNKKISLDGYGKDISNKKLSEIFKNLQDMGAHNINLVTPTIYVPQISKALKMANLKIPVVYNTSSYENTKTIKMMNGLVDIYLADLKYYDDIYAIKYSKTKDYFKNSILAIKEMYEQVGKPIIKDDLMKKGVIVRILILPGLKEDAKKIIKYLYDTYQDNIYLSIMNQYTPIGTFKDMPELNHKISDNDYDEIVNYAYDLGVKKAFIQEGDTQEESFIPDFDIKKI
jgi:putative pyruvate formate lyase activating enzyme